MDVGGLWCLLEDVGLLGGWLLGGEGEVKLK